MPYGGRRRGSGRKPGVTKKLLEGAERAVKWSGMTPCEFFQQVMQDTEADLKFRLEAAAKAAIYVHKKMPEKLDVDSTVQYVGEEVVIERRAAEENA